MTISADTLQLLIDQGINGDALVAIVRSMEADHGPSKSSGAERQRRYRERQKAERECDVTHNVTGDATESDAPISLDKKAPQTPKKINPISGECDAPARKGSAWICPEGIDPEHWRDLLANRKSKRLTNTPTAYKRLLADLLKFSDDEWPPGRIIQHAAERGWGAIFDPRERRNGTRSTEPSGIGRTGEAGLDVFGHPRGSPH